MLVFALLLFSAFSAVSTVRGGGGGSEQSASPTNGFVGVVNNFLIVAPSGKNVSVTGTAILLNGIDIVAKLAAQDQAIATMQAQLVLLAPLPAFAATTNASLASLNATLQATLARQANMTSSSSLEAARAQTSEASLSLSLGAQVGVEALRAMREEASLAQQLAVETSRGIIVEQSLATVQGEEGVE